MHTMFVVGFQFSAIFSMASKRKLEISTATKHHCEPWTVKREIYLGYRRAAVQTFIHSVKYNFMQTLTMQVQ